MFPTSSSSIPGLDQRISLLTLYWGLPLILVSSGTLLPAPSGLRGTWRELVMPEQRLGLPREAALEARTR